MNTNEIVAFFVNEAPRYNTLSNKEKKIYYAVLQSIPSKQLDEVAGRLSKEESIPWDLLNFIDWMKKDHSQKAVIPNEPISTLIEWYRNKSSKMVSYAYKRLVERFDTQDFDIQKEIIGLFLKGGKKASEKAASWLRKCWIPGFEDEIDAAWKTYKGEVMARTIIYEMPEEYVMKEQDELAEAVSYAIVCGRLGRTPGFEIEESKLSILDWFYVVGKLGLTEKILEMDEKANRFILNLDDCDYVGYEGKSGYSLLYELGMSRIIWAMKQLHYTEGIVRLTQLEHDAVRFVDDSGTSEKSITSLIEALKILVKDDLPY